MENQNPEVQNTEAQNNQPLIITLVDLDMLRQIIDLAASRGAFKGPELGDVGAVYNKLSAFLDMAAAQAQADQEATDPAAPAPTVDTPPQGE